MNNNQLSGELPAAITKVLFKIILSENKLTGDISSLKFLETLDILSLSGNCFYGNLPDVPTNASCYDLADNEFSGTVPASHSKMMDPHEYGIYGTKYGADYNISNNNLSGDLPAEFTSHPHWHVHWFNVLPQKTGYGFSRTDIPAHRNPVKCYDGTLLYLGEEYSRNKYTLLFRWDPYCPGALMVISDVETLYNKYKDQGLGLVCMTHVKYNEDEMKLIDDVFPEVHKFWETSPGQGYVDPDDPLDNNPYGLNRYFYLFRTGVTPYFYVVNSEGNIECFGSGNFYSGSIPQYKDSDDEIFDFLHSVFE
jgi:hypothetical protein